MTGLQTRSAGAARIWASGLSITAMLALVTLMIPADGIPSQNPVSSTVWWYAARASGLVAWVLLGTSVIAGLLLTTQLAQGRTRSWTQGLHEFLGALVVVFTTVHLATVFATDQLDIGLHQLLVPFTRLSNPMAQGFGVLAGYLLTAVVLTSWARAALPWRWWRRLHLLSFPVLILASAHTVLDGTDITSPVMHRAGLAAGTVMLFLVMLRL